MSNEFQDVLDKDRLDEARYNLNSFTQKIKKRYEFEIHNDACKVIDEMQLGFINENPNLTFEEIRLLKKFCDYIKR